MQNEALLEKVIAQEGWQRRKKTGKKPSTRKIRVDRRRIDKELPPPHVMELLHIFAAGPQIEHIQYPRIIYPYITKLIAK